MLYESSADAVISLPPDSGAVLLSFWLLYCPPGASAGGPACFPAGTAVRDVLHAAQAAAEQGEAHAATQQTLLTLRLRVPAACAAPRDVLARVLGPSACALPGPGGGRAVAALPFAGAILRAQAPRKHAADLQLAMPTAPHASRQAAVLPLVRATPVMPCVLARLTSRPRCLAHQAREALLRRALTHAPPPTADDAVDDDDTLAALRALRCRLIACQARRRVP